MGKSIKQKLFFSKLLRKFLAVYLLEFFTDSIKNIK